ncbi:hypothetical protein I549_2262 [Mycobacterium avium subsp. avium 2285 (R)]|nr:hypothetical protein I549_2262 [Mycobacterium avium subsp. avium 2285 (R)]
MCTSNLFGPNAFRLAGGRLRGRAGGAGAMPAAPGASGAGRLVGALTVDQSLFTLGVSRATKNPRQLVLHEGCALVLDCFTC